MKAVRYKMPKVVSVDDVPDPRIEQPRDAVVRVTSTAICGSDLHIYNGLLPQMTPMVFGHEFMGVVEELGTGVTNLQVGDRVVVPFPIADGTCWFCTHGLPTQCENSNPNYGPEGGLIKGKGGGIFGYSDLYGGHPGGQAEKVRVPYADYGPRKVPENLRDEQVILLTDVLPTGWTAAERARIKEGDTVAVFGCGPVGLATMKSAWAMGAGHVIGIDILPYRLEMARKVAGAETLNADEVDVADEVRARTGGRGADACVDAVGMEAHRNILEKINAIVHMQRGTIDVLKEAIDAVRRGGTVSIIGVYGTPFDNFPLGQIFDKQVSIETGQAPVHNHIDHLMRRIAEGSLRTDDIITHVMPLDEAPRAYEMFKDKTDGCVKVVLKP